jgi:hypothetical protein
MQETKTRLASIRFGLSLMLFVFSGVFLNGCRSLRGAAEPSIEFPKVPPASQGGPDITDTIEGRVIGARPGQQIVLFAHSGQWWVQPLVARPFTKIQADSTWTNSIHLGLEYAALLVEEGYTPQPTMASLPEKGGQILAISIVKGSPAPPELNKIVHFSGYDWKVRTMSSERGGAITRYGAENVWTDNDNALHLRLTKNSGKWTGAEVNLTRSLGYGTYRFVVRESAHLEPSAVIGLFTWDDSSLEQNHREFDVELTRWGDPHSKNAQFAVQPYYLPANVERFTVPFGPVTYSVHWEPGKLSFRADRGVGSRKGAVPIADHIFTSGVPTPGGEQVHMDLYVFGGAPEPLKSQNEAVIEKFEYLP